MTKGEFEILYNQLKDRVYNTVLSYVQNTEDAEEIAQDVFIEIYHKANTFKGNSSISTWIYRIAVNKSIDKIKHRNRKKRFAWLVDVNEEKNAGSLPDFNHPGILLEQKEQAAQLFRAVQKLSTNQKTAFILKYMENLNQKEIAAIMNTTSSAIESLLQRAKQFLRSEISKNN